MDTRAYETGGGIVFDHRDRILLIERHVPREEGERHEIRLPKGHIDPGETPEQAALREVREETGYGALEVLAPLGHHDVEFDYAGAHVQRREHYFLMRLLDDTPGQPNFSHGEEALFRVRWVAGLDEAIHLLTYESEKEFARRAREIWPTLPR